jgi:hypothetical protein
MFVWTSLIWCRNTWRERLMTPCCLLYTVTRNMMACSARADLMDADERINTLDFGNNNQSLGRRFNAYVCVRITGQASSQKKRACNTCRTC